MTSLQIERWKIAFETYCEQAEAFKDFQAGLYHLVLGQCTEALKDHIKSYGDFAAANQDGHALLRIVSEITFSYEKDRREMSDQLCNAKETFYSLPQKPTADLRVYHDRFAHHVKLMKHLHITIADPDLIFAIARRNEHGSTPDNADREAAHQKALATRFIRGAVDYLSELRRAFLDGNDNYPATLHDAYNILQRCEPSWTTPAGAAQGDASVTAGADGRTHSHITCHKCGKEGHMPYLCPVHGSINDDGADQQQDEGGLVSRFPNPDIMPTNVRSMAASIMMVPISNTIKAGLSIVSRFPNPAAGSLTRGSCWTTSPRWTFSVTNRCYKMFVVLENACTSTATPEQGGRTCKGTCPDTEWYCSHAIANILSLHNVKHRWRVTYDSLNGDAFHCNAGTRWPDMQGDLPGYGTVWYCSHAIANILSLHNVKHRWRVTYDSLNGDGFVVTKDHGTVNDYRECGDGLHYCDMACVRVRMRPVERLKK